LDAALWTQAGASFFMAGIAVMLASTSDFDRPAYLVLAEQIHPGASRPETFAQWLKESPLQPCRFLPMLKVRVRQTAKPGS
jgi:phosphohistidine phosphatase SixA